jgi:hypothetical protein
LADWMVDVATLGDALGKMAAQRAQTLRGRAI